MNCRSFRKYLEAFADGELDTPANLDALEHLNFCEACARKVVNIQQLRIRLAEAFGDQPIPQELRHRVLVSVGVAPRTQADGPRRRQWLAVPLGVAAAIALFWAASPWQTAPTGSSFADANPPVARWISSVRAQHLDGTTPGTRPRTSSLPCDTKLLSARLESELAASVAAPDLGGLGFTLERAERCRIDNLPGAHLVYRRLSDGKQLSVFTTGAMETDSGTRELKARDRECFVCSRQGPTVLAWHGGGATYVVCAKLSVGELVRVALSSR